jgi:hypothetical protein
VNLRVVTTTMIVCEIMSPIRVSVVRLHASGMKPFIEPMYLEPAPVLVLQVDRQHRHPI